MKAHTIFQQADEDTIQDILGWMRNNERMIYHAAVRELGALKKLRPQYIQSKPVADQLAWLKKMLSWKPAEDIGDHLLQVWLLRKHQQMLIMFLAALEIKHNGHGVVDVLPDEIDADKLSKGVDELFERYRPGVVSAYLQMFQRQTPTGWGPLAAILANDPRVIIKAEGVAAPVAEENTAEEA